MKKKLFVLIIISLLVAIGFSGCFGEDGSEEENEDLKSYDLRWQMFDDQQNVPMDNMYRPGDSVEFSVDAPISNTRSVGFYIFFKSRIGGGGGTTEVTPPDSKVEYLVQEEQGVESGFDYYIVLYHLQTENSGVTINASCQAEALDIANQEYSNNGAVGMWNFKITFDSGAVFYTINNCMTLCSYLELRVEEID